MTVARIAVAAVALAISLEGAALAAEPSPRRTYQGQVKDCIGRCPTVTLGVTRSVRRMKVKATWDATCESRGGFAGGNNVYSRGTKTRDPIRVGRRGRFSVKGRYDESPPTSYGGPEGLAASVVFRLRGRFTSSRKASGRFSVSVVLKDSTGATRDRCKASERFTARRRPRR